MKNAIIPAIKKTDFLIFLLLAMSYPHLIDLYKLLYNFFQLILRIIYLQQLNDKDKIYLSDGIVSDIRAEQELLEEIRYCFEDISKIRKPQSYKSIYEGYSDDGLKFSTDLNVMRIYTVNEEEYYKIPVTSKDELKNILNKIIFTSFFTLFWLNFTN